MTSDSRPYLDPKVLDRIEGLDLKARLIVEGYVSGLHKSPFRGFSVEFVQHREYAPGDDLKHIDWKAYKRLNRLLLRLFDEEQDLPIYLMLDSSRSMAEPAKFDQARKIAAALCYIGLAHLDRVTILPFGNSLGRESRVVERLGVAIARGVLDRAADESGLRGEPDRLRHDVGRVTKALLEIRRDRGRPLLSGGHRAPRQQRDERDRQRKKTAVHVFVLFRISGETVSATIGPATDYLESISYREAESHENAQVSLLVFAS